MQNQCNSGTLQIVRTAIAQHVKYYSYQRQYWYTSGSKLIVIFVLLELLNTRRREHIYFFIFSWCCPRATLISPCLHLLCVEHLFSALYKGHFIFSIRIFFFLPKQQRALYVIRDRKNRNVGGGVIHRPVRNLYSCVFGSFVVVIRQFIIFIVPNLPFSC